MFKSNKEFIEEAERLTAEITALREELRHAKESIVLIKAENIDALVLADKQNVRVYTDKTADKTFRILIEKMHEGAVTLDKEGTILYCNSCFASMVDLPLQKIIGTPFQDYIIEPTKGHFDVAFKKSWIGFLKEEVYLKAQASIMMPVLLSANTFEADNMVLLSVIITDITHKNKSQQELKQKNEELEEANKELAIQNAEKEKRAEELSIANQELVFQKNEKEKRAKELGDANSNVKELEELIAHKESILAILSHDLRSPLAGIIGTAEFLKLNFKDMNKVDMQEMLDQLHESSTKELNMLDYLVEWARIKYASDVFSPSKIELLEYVGKVFDTLKDTAAMNTINLHQEIEPNMNVFADGKMLLSILQNIVSNAIKHSHPNGKITIAAKKIDGEVIVEIRDTGIGMSEEIQKNLFSPQMDSLSEERKNDKGAGIGLLLVKGFLEKNGGRIWVESVEGVGSSFYFTLPVNSPLDKIS